MKRRALGVLLAAMCVTAVPSVAYAGLYATPSDAAQTDAAATDAGTDAAAPAEEAAPAEAAATAETAPATEAADSAAPAEAAETAPADGTGLTEVAAPVAEQADAALSDNIYDFQIKINDHVYQFPTTYEEFSSQGWVMESGYENETLDTNSYVDITVSNDTEKVNLTFLNLGINALPYEQCLIGGISIDGTYNVNLSRTTVELAGGIQMGKSTFEDIKAAYGDPSETSETDYYTEYIYKKDYHEMVDLYVYKDDNTFKKVRIQNLVEPEGYDKGSVSDDVPDIVTAYAAPSALSDDIMAPQVEFCGDLYTLPAPVTAFLANGWTMVDVADDAYVSGGGTMETLDMMKNNQTVQFYVYNMTDNATAIQNCFVRQLEASTLNEAITLKTSGNLTLGSKKSDIKALAEAKGYIMTEDADSLTIYKSENSKMDTQLHFRFFGDDPEIATNIQYENRVLQ